MPQYKGVSEHQHELSEILEQVEELTGYNLRVARLVKPAPTTTTNRHMPQKTLTSTFEVRILVVRQRPTDGRTERRHFDLQNDTNKMSSIFKLTSNMSITPTPRAALRTQVGLNVSSSSIDTYRVIFRWEAGRSTWLRTRPPQWGSRRCGCVAPGSTKGLSPTGRKKDEETTSSNPRSCIRKQWGGIEGREQAKAISGERECKGQGEGGQEKMASENVGKDRGTRVRGGRGEKTWTDREKRETSPWETRPSARCCRPRLDGAGDCCVGFAAAGATSWDNGGRGRISEGVIMGRQEGEQRAGVSCVSEARGGQGPPSDVNVPKTNGDAIQMSSFAACLLAADCSTSSKARCTRSSMRPTLTDPCHRQLLLTAT
ncbi:hypothetical protein DFH09DRAFT_1081695 [Mycena vulgaris]|nr:hypothetical protein DFH09DRAFT_1081695 [Mycena vulgaris]